METELQAIISESLTLMGLIGSSQCLFWIRIKKKSSVQSTELQRRTLLNEDRGSALRESNLKTCTNSKMVTVKDCKANLLAQKKKNNYNHNNNSSKKR
jgi:hypothetical protein